MADMITFMHTEALSIRWQCKNMENLRNGKSAGAFHIRSEMLKWTGPVVKEWIHALLNKAIAMDQDTI